MPRHPRESRERHRKLDAHHRGLRAQLRHGRRNLQSAARNVWRVQSKSFHMTNPESRNPKLETNPKFEEVNYGNRSDVSASSFPVSVIRVCFGLLFPVPP